LIESQLASFSRADTDIIKMREKNHEKEAQGKKTAPQITIVSYSRSILCPNLWQIKKGPLDSSEAVV